MFQPCLRSLRATPIPGMGLLAPARGIGLQDPQRSPPQSLRQLWRKRQMTQPRTTNKIK